MSNIEYRIMGVPSRIENIKKLQKQLDISNNSVFLDTEYHKSPMWTWSKTSMIQSSHSTTHICIVQDDAVLCDDFKDFCSYLANKFPNIIFTLYSYLDWNKHNIPYGSVFKPGCVTSAVVILLPKKYTSDIVQLWESEYKDLEQMDDRMVCFWAHNNNVKVCTTYPTCCDMLLKDEGLPSLLSHSDEGRHSKNFVNKTMDISWKDLTNWHSVYHHRNWSTPWGKEEWKGK